MHQAATPAEQARRGTGIQVEAAETYRAAVTALETARLKLAISRNHRVNRFDSGAAHDPSNPQALHDAGERFWPARMTPH